MTLKGGKKGPSRSLKNSMLFNDLLGMRSGPSPRVHENPEGYGDVQ
jgi:hypothetical protein